MPWENSYKNIRLLDSFGISSNHTLSDSGGRKFYELELGVVLDIVLDLKHPIFTKPNSLHTHIDPDHWPADLTDAPPSKGDPDLSWIGRALVRPLISGRIIEKDQLNWAYPLENNFTEYPLVNETVILSQYKDKLYYTRKVNCKNWPNNNLDFTIAGGTAGMTNTELFSKAAYKGTIQTTTAAKAKFGYYGYAGKYFYGNPKIRTLRRFEGDILVESRFGSELLMKAFDKNRDNDIGDTRYPDYKNSGNPMLILRNRQRPLLKVGQTLSLQHSPNPATISGTIEEKNVGGYLEENINHDGSSIYITSGLTVSDWVTTCFKRMFHDVKDEEVPKFRGNSNFVYPILNGDQIIINSDRLIFSSRYGETFHYSKKRYAVVTDSEYTVDSHDQIVLTTHVKTVLNSPAIYLGEYNQSGEPVLLGQTTVNWLHELCDWLIEHCHKHDHGHPHAGAPSPRRTQPPVPEHIKKLELMRDALHTLLSRRVFVTGGGLAPGQDGASIPEGVPPVKITIDNAYE